MTGIINGVTNIVTASAVWLGQGVSVVTQGGNELLLFFVLSGFVGIAIGLLMRFVRSR